MKHIVLMFCITLSFACFAKNSEPLPGITVQVPANYAQEADIPPKVRAECTEIERLTGQLIADELKDRKYAVPTIVDEVNEASFGIALKTEIIGIVASPGGGWSGGKTMTVKAELFQDGILIDSTVRSRSSKGGLFGAVKGNCDILERDAEALAADIYVWLVRLTKSKTLPAQLLAAPTVMPAPTDETATAAHDAEKDISAHVSPASVSLLPSASKSLFIRTPAGYAPAANIRRAILDECHLDRALTNNALELFERKVPNSTGLTPTSDTRDKDVLEFTILTADGEAGGSASGPKSMSMRVQLLRNGEVVDQYENSRSGGSMFGPMKGTCTTLAAISRALANDSANWYLKRTKIDNSSQASTEGEPLNTEPEGN